MTLTSNDICVFCYAPSSLWGCKCVETILTYEKASTRKDEITTPTGNKNLICALLGGAILMKRNTDEVYAFIDGVSKRMNPASLIYAIRYNLVKYAGSDFPHDTYYVSTIDDILQNDSEEKKLFIRDMEGSLTYDGFSDSINFPEMNLVTKGVGYDYLYNMALWRFANNEQRYKYLKRLEADFK